MKNKGIYMIAFLMVNGLFQSCERAGNCYMQSGRTITKEIYIKGIDQVNSIVLRGNISLYLNEGETGMAEVRSGENLIEGIIFTVKDSVMEIHDEIYCNWLSGYKHHMDVFLTLKELKQIDFSGSSGLYTTDTLEFGNRLVLGIGNSTGEINMNIHGGYFQLNHYFGATDIMISGKVNSCGISHIARGRLELSSLETKRMTIKSTSVNHAYVYATEVLNAGIFESGNVYYHGNPIVEAIVEGKGKLIKID